MNNTSLRHLASRYSPVLAVILAAALFVTVVPSRPGSRQVAAGFDYGSAPRAGSGRAGGVIGDEAGDGVGPDGAGTGEASAEAAGGAGGPGAAGGSSTSETSSAAASGLDCSRNQLVKGPTCRPPRWSGDNGGATAPGVTADKVTIVLYVPKRNAQVQAILAAAGTASSAEQIEVLERYEKWFNDRYELYGRKLDLVFQEGPGAGADPAENQADAALVAGQLKAFYAVCAACATSFHDELARREVPSTTVIVPFMDEYHRRLAPHLYGVLPDFDLTTRSGAEYYCKRLQGRRAEHAGAEGLRNQTRSLGIIAVDTPDDPGGRYRRAIEACGGKVSTVVRYAPDITTAAQQATNAIIQVQRSGANIVTCVCDVVAPVFLTSAATQQNYFPEWFSNGLYAMDSFKAAQLYDQQQWAHAFGIGSISKPEPIAEEEWYRAYKAGGGSNEQAIENAGGSIFSGVVQAVDAIERAGPRLTLDSFTQAMLSMPPYGHDRVGGSHQSFGNNGPGFWTRVDDHNEIWWDPNRTASNDRRGSYFYVEAGRRYLVGEWPRTDPNVFVDDKSPQ